MASCANCGSTIVLGGITQGNERYCNDRCATAGRLVQVAANFPAAEIERRVREVHQGSCPRCKGPGPVDVHTSHSIWSLLLLTRWSSHPRISCRPCGKKQQLEHLAMSLVTGWWGFPWGLIMTPVMVVKNIGGLAGSGYDPRQPSAELQRIVRLMAGAELAANPSAVGPPRTTPPPLPTGAPSANG
jgi:hypothetical protein